MLLKKFIFNRAIDEKEKCDVSEFKDGDEYGKTKEMMGIIVFYQAVLNQIISMMMI